MPTKSFKEFFRETREPQDDASRILLMTVRNFLDAVENEDDSTAEVTLDSPEPDRISVAFFP